MTLYSSAPAFRPFSDDKPTLLISWWITALCSVVIALRVAGRFVRVEKLFLEDKVTALALIPLFLRMALIHVVLVYGTNNVLLDGQQLFDTDISHRAIGSGLVLLTRLLYPAVLWALKVATLLFLERLVGSTGKRRYTWTLLFLRVFLAATFGAVVVSDLAECPGFQNYWTVTPDPGGRCRQGYGNLLTVAVCSALTDLMLVIFPITVVVSSRLPLGRKFMLSILFCLGLFTVIVSIYRAPQIVGEHGYQATRTMWASAEILVATIATNAQALGSFMRDTGVKKAKFTYDPDVNSAEARAAQRAARKDVWDDSDDGPAADHSESVEPSAKLRESNPSTIALSRTASQDSLIPRSRFALANGDVMKTTTIRVTVSAAAEADDRIGTLSRHGSVANRGPIERTVLASGRGTVRGTTVPLQSLGPLPSVEDSKR
ncbi:hypothetical protein B0T24DRAFT_219251 [Lasiosphaeria ovina]|uniref:Rhodopsin domain-containing protein n=1 Tax=Lasiosphaeria ovina TaxID=92902 RepID=A0AAE0KIE9_9PEZI|nr:hypothetical protein B0T24DRAFT_219251 [Lasiosphaeria ovina]